MGFKSVYRCLQEIFPKIDSRLLRAVAIEHSKDADQAVEVVIKEIIPYLSSKTVGPVDPPEDIESDPEEQIDLLRQKQVVEEADVGPSSKPGALTGENAKETDHTGGALHAGSTHLVEALNESTDSDFYDANDGNDQSFGNTESSEVILLGKAEENSVKVGLDEIVHATSNALLHGRKDNQKQVSGGPESEELVSFGTCKEIHVEVVPEEIPLGMTTSLSNEKDGANGILNDPNYDWKDFDFPVADDSDAVIIGKSAKSCSDSTKVSNSVAQLVSPSVEEQIPVAPECGVQSECGSEPSVSECVTEAAGGPSDVTFNQDYFVSEMTDIEEEPRDTIVTRSGQVCKVDLLEEIIEDAKNNKKTLFLAMEVVINMMREVEVEENAAEQAKAEAAMGGLDILVKVEELREMLAHAKEANNMHSGEVYGERAILATEVRELQSRLMSLSDERDKSLAILDEMRQTLEARLAMAEEMKKAAEQERLEKEESARKALAEQEAIMEKVVHESKILQQEADENSKLQEFLMNRGHILDMLQGEISVICQDVRLLKEKFDDRVPLSKSVSSSQTTCILASSGSSVKSMASDLVLQCNLASSGSSLKSIASDLVPEQGESSTSPEKTSPTPSVHSLSPKSRLEEERTGADHQVLLDDGWEFFEKDAELDF